MKHSKWKTKIISVSGYLVKWTHMKIKAHIHSGWAAAHAAIVKGCRRVIWKAFGKEVSDPKALQQVWNGCNTCNSNNELTTCGVLRLRPAENVTDTTRGRKPSGAGWNKNLLLWCTFGFSDRMIIKGKVCAIYLKNFNGYDEIEIQNSRILQDIGV